MAIKKNVSKEVAARPVRAAGAEAAEEARRLVGAMSGEREGWWAMWSRKADPRYSLGVVFGKTEKEARRAVELDRVPKQFRASLFLEKILSRKTAAAAADPKAVYDWYVRRVGKKSYGIGLPRFSLGWIEATRGEAAEKAAKIFPEARGEMELVRGRRVR